jgi:hypothetical protein
MKNQKNLFLQITTRLLFLVLVATTIIGCSSQKAWVYTPNQYQRTAVVSTKKAVVLPFEDTRENRNDNDALLYLIPLFPYGWQDLNVPEGEQMHLNSGLWTNYKPTEDFAKALAAELETAHYFKEAYFDFKKTDSGYIFKGKILNTHYEGKIFSYGLSAYGPLLWFFGLPATDISNELSVELSMMEANTEKVVFSKSYTAPTYNVTSSMYTIKNDFNYSAMLKDIFREFCNDLEPYFGVSKK